MASLLRAPATVNAADDVKGQPTNTVAKPAVSDGVQSTAGTKAGVGAGAVPKAAATAGAKGASMMCAKGAGPYTKSGVSVSVPIPVAPGLSVKVTSKPPGSRIKAKWTTDKTSGYLNLDYGIGGIGGQYTSAKDQTIIIPWADFPKANGWMLLDECGNCIFKISMVDIESRILANKACNATNTCVNTTPAVDGGKTPTDILRALDNQGDGTGERLGKTNPVVDAESGPKVTADSSTASWLNSPVTWVIGGGVLLYLVFGGKK